MPQRVPAGRINLKPTQRRILAALSSGGSEELTRGQYEEIAGVSRSQAAYDLAELVEGGILERVGGGRSTRYRLARQAHPAHRRWTNERIRAALADFCAGRETWPSASAFKAAGRADLYVAASRYGGIGFWAAELGFPRPGRAATPRASEPWFRSRLGWAAGGAALAVVVFGTAGAVMQGWHGGQASKPGRGHATIRADSARSSLQGARSRSVAGSAALAPTKSKPKPRQTSAPRSRSSRSEARQTGGAYEYRTELAVQTISTATPRQTQVSPRPSASSSRPTPLPAPPLASTHVPAPLPPP